MASITPTSTPSVRVTLDVLEVTNMTIQEPMQVQNDTKIIQASNNVTYVDPNATSGPSNTTYWTTG